MAKTISVSVEQGATLEIPITAKDKDGAAIDLTDATITAKIADENNAIIATEFTVTKTSAVDGEFLLELTDETTENLTPGKYFFDVKVAFGVAPGPNQGKTFYYLGRSTMTIGPVITD